MLTDLKTKEQVIGVATATIKFGDISSDIIDKLLEEGFVIHCAGGLMMEHELVQPCIRSITGGQDSLMGLSCKLLADLFAELYD